MNARAVGQTLLFVSGLGLGRALACALLGDWKQAAIGGIVGALAGIGSRFAVLVELRAMLGRP